MSEQQPNISETVIDWARYTINDWRVAIRKKNIKQTGELERSFVHHVVSAADGDIQRIKFMFKFYGVFVDMGVGKGVDIAHAGELKAAKALQGSKGGNRRAPKKWRGKAQTYNMYRLAEILQKEYGFRAVLAVTDKNNLTPKVNITL